MKDVVKTIGPEVTFIYVVDDKCPEKSGEYLSSVNRDKRVRVIFHDLNHGVGGAVISGYQQAVIDGADVIVKIDGDGQMDPSLIQHFIKPILLGKADYTKGNRFYRVEFLNKMPAVRLLGNAILSFVNKLASGYWDIMDPTNGYTAIHASVLKLLALEKIDKRYFFESDMLFRLGILRAVVRDIPMYSVYAGESSGLNIKRVIQEFPMKYLRRFFKRIFYQYFLRDFNAGTLELSTGLILMLGGASYGAYKWAEAVHAAEAATSGVVMLATIPLLVGAQLVISAINYDIYSVPRTPLHLENITLERDH